MKGAAGEVCTLCRQLYELEGVQGLDYVLCTFILIPVVLLLILLTELLDWICE
jgi:hypothetical protein